MDFFRSPNLSRTGSSKGWDGTVLGLSVKSSPGKMMALGGEIHDRVPVAGLKLARMPKVPEVAEQVRSLGLLGRTGEPVCGPGSVTLSQSSQQQRVSQGDPKTMVPGSLEEKEVH